MNLPPPFGPITTRPPMVTFYIYIFRYWKKDSQFKIKKFDKRSKVQTSKSDFVCR